MAMNMQNENDFIMRNGQVSDDDVVMILEMAFEHNELKWSNDYLTFCPIETKRTLLAV